MESHIKKINDLESELTVELTKEDLLSYISRAEEEIRAGLEVDGFRKGKVPREQLKKFVSPPQILEVALENALRGSFAEVIREKDLDVIKTDDLKVQENTADKLKYSVRMTCYPEFNLPVLETISVQRKTVAVEEKEITDTVDSIRGTRATFTKKDGVAEKGDRVEIDFEVSENGKVIEGGVSKNHPLILGKGSFIPGFEDNLIGMKAEEEKEFSLPVAKDFSQKEIAGKTLSVKAKMNNVETVQLPEFNDEFVKTLGNFPDVASLKANIGAGLLQEKEDKESQRVRMEVLEAIIKASEIPAPKVLVDQQLDTMVADFDQHLHSQGMELGLYLAHIKKTQDELRKDWYKDAEKQVRLNLVLHKLAKIQNIEVSEEEITDGVAALVDSLAARGEAENSKLDPVRLKDYVANQLTRQKVFDLIENKCVSKAK